MERRELIKASSSATVLGLGLSTGLITLPAHAQSAWNKAAFDAKNLNDVVKAMGGAAPTESKDVVLQAPEIAENGNVVRIGASSTNPAITQLALLIEKNPNALAAVFEAPAGTDANFATNVKMGQSSNVYALAKMGDKYVYAVKEVKVTLGGCGG